MTQRNKNSFSLGWLLLIIFLAISDLVLLLKRLLHGHNIALFNPQGTIAKQQHGLMLYTASVLLTIGIPTLFFLYYTAWKYRESNTKATYNPNLVRGNKYKIGVWVIPGTVMLMLASVMWPATHRLAPQKAIAADASTLTIQVVAMRWKWLFIYPQQGIATVNFVQFPVNTPLKFELTSDEAPMSSFWIPNLGGQLYTMTGHVNQLNLMANSVGDYPGKSAEINGAGFSGMKFTARASDSIDFYGWIQSVKKSPVELNAVNYDNLLKPSQYNPAAFYSVNDSNLYARVITKYTGLYGSHSRH